LRPSAVPSRTPELLVLRRSRMSHRVRAAPQCEALPTDCHSVLRATQRRRHLGRHSRGCDGHHARHRPADGAGQDCAGSDGVRRPRWRRVVAFPRAPNDLFHVQQQRRTGRRGVQEGRGVEPRSHRRSVGRGCHRVGARQERQRDGTGQPAG